MLTSQQIDKFKDTGVLIFSEFFSREEMAVAKAEVELYYNNPTNPVEWWDALAGKPDLRPESPTFPTPKSHQKLAALYATLHDQLDWLGHNQLVLRPKHLTSGWIGARAPHLDFPIGQPIKFLANIAFNLTDVEKHGGAFMYWPGSHIAAWEHFKKHPLDYLSRGERGQDPTFAIIKNTLKNEPVEFLGKAGDLILWDSFLLHSPSINTNNLTRMTVFGRFGPSRAKGEEHFDFNADKWSEWRFNSA